MKFFWIAAATTSLAIVGAVCVQATSGPLNADFTMFWTLRELAYPPPYLLTIKPLTYLPYGLAFTIWILLTGAVYVIANSKSPQRAIANPAATFNGLVGQNGFLTCGVIVLGLRQLPARPLTSGLILGLLIIKPHLAIVLPLVVVATRAWKAIPAALAMIGLLTSLSFLVFGASAFTGFFYLGSKYGDLVSQGGWPWGEVASVYALARWFNASSSAAWTLHALIGFIASLLVWRAWRWDHPGKVPVTCSAALLVSPYLFTYDAVLLTPALIWLRGPKTIALWGLLAVPFLRVFFHQDWPNTVPLAAAFAACVITMEEGVLRRLRMCDRAVGMVGR